MYGSIYIRYYNLRKTVWPQAGLPKLAQTGRSRLKNAKTLTVIAGESTLVFSRIIKDFLTLYAPVHPKLIHL